MDSEARLCQKTGFGCRTIPDISVLNNPNVPPQIMCVGTESSRDLEFCSNNIIFLRLIIPVIYQSAIVDNSLT